MSEQTTHLVEILRQRLRVAARRTTLADLLYGLVLTLGIGAALWLGAVAVEAGFWLDVTPRTVLFWVLLVAALGLVGLFLVRPLLRLTGLLAPPSEEVVARRVGARYPEVSDRLVNLLHLVEGKRSETPPALLDGAVQMLGEPIRTVPFDQVEDFYRAKRASRLASLPVVGMAVFLLAAPGTFLGATHRLFSPGTHFQRPAPFQLVVSPGDVDLVRGAALEVIIRAPGTEQPRALTLELNNRGEEHIERITLTPDAEGIYRHTIPNIRQSLRYRAHALPVETEWFDATVTDRPLVRTLDLALAFPSYTRIPPQRLAPNVGDIAALTGTQVSLDVGIGGREVTEAAVRFDDGTEIPLEIEGSQARGTFTHSREGAYQIVLRNRRGVANDDPIRYTLKLLDDAYPSILLVEPSPDLDLDDTRFARLRMRLTDDFGFSRLRLFFRLAESRFGEPTAEFQTVDVPLTDPRQLDQDVLFDWLLTQTGLNPIPGDVIEYYVQVWDNDSVAGYKTARSGTHRLRMPALAERYEQLDEQQDAAEEGLEELLREHEGVRQEFQQLRDELRQKQQGDWEDQRQLEQLQERQQQLEERVEQLSDQLENTTRQMQENSLVSPETMEMYRELQRVTEEINSPELQQALEELREAMEELNLQQMQEAIEQFEFNEQQYQQRLQRTLDLLKNLRVQQELEEVARRAEELARQQERLAEETERLDREGEPENRREEEKDQGEQREGEQQSGEQQENEQSQNRQGEQQEGENQEGEQREAEQREGEPQNGERQEGEPRESEKRPDTSKKEQLAQEQERNAEEMRQLEEQMRELLDQMKELRNTPAQQMEQLNEQTQQQQLPQQMEQNAEQLRQQQNQQAKQQQQQMQQMLQQLQQQLQQMQQGMQQQQQQINMSGLRRVLTDILTLSQQQEGLRQELDGSAEDSPRLREFAQQQVELSEGLTTVSDSLQRLASDIPQMTRKVQEEAGSALRAMGEATGALSERSSRAATGQQKESMMHLNELALLLSDLMEQMQNQQQGSGGMSMQQMLQQLQQMAGQQQQLNEQIQQMLNDMQGNRLTQDMQNRLRQMAAQQDALRRQLKEMSRNRELGDQTLGDLEKIAEEMEEAIEQMQRGQLDRPFIQRQQRILTRLLDASKSLREQGEEKKREGQSADDILRSSPGELTPQEQAEQLRRALLRALESGYAPDYEELIKRYFELLQQQQTESPPPTP